MMMDAALRDYILGKEFGWLPDEISRQRAAHIRRIRTVILAAGEVQERERRKQTPPPNMPHPR